MNSVSHSSSYFNLKLYNILLSRGLAGFSKTDYKKVAELVVKLFSKDFLYKFVKSENLKELKKQIYSKYLDFESVQELLEDNLLTTSKIISAKTTKQILSSYAILPFPYQMSYQRQEQHQAQIRLWDQLLIRAEELLYERLDGESKEELTPEQQFRLHRLLYLHPAYYLHGKTVTWISVIEQWMGGDQSRPSKVWPFLNNFKENLLQSNLMPEPLRSENEIDRSLKDYVVECTVSSVEDVLDLKFSEFSIYVLKLDMVKSEVRQDVAYFLLNRRRLKGYKLDEKRVSHRLIGKFQLYWKLTEHEQRFIPLTKQVLFDLILLSDFSKKDRDGDMEQLLSDKIRNYSYVFQIIKQVVVNSQEYFEDTFFLYFYYSISPFPFQSTYTLKNKHPKKIEAWNKRFVDSEKHLCQGILGKHILLHLYQKVDLFKLLNFYDALYENGLGVSWLQIIADWSQNDHERTKRVQAALTRLMGKKFLIPISLQEADKKEYPYVQGISLEDYVIRRTIRTIENEFGFTFSKIVTKKMVRLMRNIETRYDSAFFLTHPRILRKYRVKKERAADILIRNFQILYTYNTKMKGFPPEDKRDLLHLIFLSNPEYDQCAFITQCLPYELGDALTEKSLNKAWKQLKKQIDAALKKNHESQLVYLLSFMIKHPDYCEVLSYEDTHVLEMIRFFSAKSETRYLRIKKYQLEEGKTIDSFETKISKFGPFSNHQKMFLYALATEKNFHQNLMLLTTLQAIFNVKIGAELVYQFLMRDLQTTRNIGGRVVDVFEQIMSPLRTMEASTKEFEKEQLQDAFRECINKLFQLDYDADQKHICVELHRAIWKKIV